MSCNDYALKYLKINVYDYESDHKRTFDIPRPFDIIAQITSGEVEFGDTEGNIIHAKAGDIVFIPMGCSYTMCWHGDKPQNIAIHYQFQKEQNNYSLQLIEGVSYKIDPYEDNELLQLSTFYKVYYLCKPHIKKSKVHPYDNRISVAVEFIRSNYDIDFSIDQLADMCHLSPSRFHYLFKKSVGYTAIDYKNKVKIDIAMQMLISTNLSIEEISDKLNFNSSVYFRRVFKKIAGMSATQYKTQYFKQEM